MSARPETSVALSPTLLLSAYLKTSGHAGFWLYDKTRGMNLSMRAKTERDAFVDALHYYQRRLADVEKEHKALQQKIDSFLCQFSDEDGAE